MKYNEKKTLFQEACLKRGAGAALESYRRHPGKKGSSDSQRDARNLRKGERFFSIKGGSRSSAGKGKEKDHLASARGIVSILFAKGGREGKKRVSSPPKKKKNPQ